MSNYPKTPRDYAGLFMVKKGIVMGAKVDAGDVQDMLAEFGGEWIRRTHAAEALVRWNAPEPNDHEEDLFIEGIRSVISIRCMAHRDIPQINKAESGTSECGECIRQQCWNDMLRLIGAAMNDTPITVDGKEALTALEASLCEDGIGTFGVADELESTFAPCS
jgi:hypothetical protein